MVRCSNCGTENQDGAAFCGKCGTALEAESTAPTAPAASKVAANGNGATETLVAEAVSATSAASTEMHYGSTEELREHVRVLLSDDRHTDALGILSAVRAQPGWSNADRDQIDDIRTTLETRQLERFNEVLQTLQREYLGDPLRPVATELEMARSVAGRLQTLRQIDASRPLTEVEDRVARLRQVSEVEWAFTRYDAEMRAALTQATNDPRHNLETFRKEIDRLGGEVLAEWEKRVQQGSDPVAVQLTPRLRELAAQANRELQLLANRQNILTTQAGTINFWAIEEEYQRWLAPGHGGLSEAPTQMPRMQWEVPTTSGNKDERRYVAVGHPLPLADWHDSFLNDAREYAVEKGERDLTTAIAALKEGSPLKAETTARILLEGDKALNKPPYFNLPDDLKHRAQKLLDSEELKFQLHRRDEARALLLDAGRISQSAEDILAALKKFRRAIVQPLDLEEQARLVRRPLLAAVKEEIERQIKADQADQVADAETARKRQSEVRLWLAELPEDPEAETARKLDPDSELQPVRRALVRHERYCHFWRQLAALEQERRKISLRELTLRLNDLKTEIEGAGFKHTEFPLLVGLSSNLSAEQSEQQLVDSQLHDPAIFTPDTDATNVQLLLGRLQTARNSTYERKKELVAALEARYALYLEKKERATLTFEGRRNLLEKVLGLTLAPSGELDLARRRLKELEATETATSAVKDRITNAENYVSVGTVEGFRQAWDELNEARTSDPKLLPEVVEVQRRVRDKLRDTAQTLAGKFPADLSDRDVEEINAWIKLVRDAGIGDMEQLLARQFNLRIWRWQAQHSPELVDRFHALAHLADHEPTKRDWRRRAVAIGLEWLVHRLEDLRIQIARSDHSLTPETDLEYRPEKVLDESPTTLRDDLGRSVEYLSKAVEIYVWLGDLSNARHILDDVRRQADALDATRANILALAELEELLALGQVNESVMGWQKQKEPPRIDQAQQLRHSYDTWLKAS